MRSLPTQCRGDYNLISSRSSAITLLGPARIQLGIISQVGLTLIIRAGERELLVAYSIFNLDVFRSPAERMSVA